MIKFKVQGKNWTIKIVNVDEMKDVRADGDFAGLCIWDDRLILIDEESVDFQTVAHEIYHAYFGYLHLGDTNNLTIDDYEEITASWFAENGEEVLLQAKKLTKELQKFKED